MLGVRKAKPHPTLGKTLLLTRVKGTVHFTPPGGQSTFLGDPMVVPNGTVIDPGNGVVKVTVERDATHALDSVDAWGTAFKGNQGAGDKPTTTLTLTGGTTSSRKVVRAALRQKKRSLVGQRQGQLQDARQARFGDRAWDLLGHRGDLGRHAGPG